MKKVVILENIRSLHNVGSVLRTADGSGWDKVYLCGYTGCPPDRRIEKVSLGAEESIEWEQRDSVVDLIEELKKDGFEVCALEQTPKAEDLLGASFEKDVALIVGNEVDGVEEATLEQCDRHLEIPMHGEKASLNVSIATGIAMYVIGGK